MSRTIINQVTWRRQAQPRHLVPPLSPQEFEERWTALHLHPQTRACLRDVLQREEGLALAQAATTALALEEGRKEPTTARSLRGWLQEEVRLLLLEEGCSHVVESGRIMVDAVATWNLMQGPATWVLLCLLILLLLVTAGRMQGRHRYRASHERPS